MIPAPWILTLLPVSLLFVTFSPQYFWCLSCVFLCPSDSPLEHQRLTSSLVNERVKWKFLRCVHVTFGGKNSHDFTIFKHVPFSNTWPSWRLQPAETITTLAHTTHAGGLWRSPESVTGDLVLSVWSGQNPPWKWHLSWSSRSLQGVYRRREGFRSKQACHESSSKSFLPEGDLQFGDSVALDNKSEKLEDLAAAIVCASW